MKLKRLTKKLTATAGEKSKGFNHCPTPQQLKTKKLKTQTEVTATKLKSSFEKAESHIVHQKHAAKTNAVKTCQEFNKVARLKTAVNLLSKPLKANKMIFVKASLRLTNKACGSLGI